MSPRGRAAAPRIGLSSCMLHPDPTRALFKGKRLLYAEESLFHWLMEGGALPYLLPTEKPSHASLEELLEPLDALVMTGGADVAPGSYGETPLKPEWSGDPERDAYDIALVRTALRVGKPVLGVCRGLQVINVALGGTLHQDITELTGSPIPHRDWDVYDTNVHDVEIRAGSRLAALYPGVSRTRINSVHHQSIKGVAPGLTVEAVSPEDGIIEAVRLTDATRYLLAVQWHPEWQDPADARLLSGAPLRAEFLAAAVAAARR